MIRCSFFVLLYGSFLASRECGVFEDATSVHIDLLLSELLGGQLLYSFTYLLDGEWLLLEVISALKDNKLAVWRTVCHLAAV